MTGRKVMIILKEPYFFYSSAVSQSGEEWSILAPSLHLTRKSYIFIHLFSWMTSNPQVSTSLFVLVPKHKFFWARKYAQNANKVYVIKLALFKSGLEQAQARNSLVRAKLQPQETVVSLWPDRLFVIKPNQTLFSSLIGRAHGL